MRFIVIKDVIEGDEDRVAKRMEDHLRTFFHDQSVIVTVMGEAEEPSGGA